jgi:hypothetical protein
LHRSRRNKRILAFESNWDGFVVEPKSGMKTLMDFITTNKGTQYSYNFINTPVEFKYTIENVNPSKFSLLYLGFHGKPNAIRMGLNKEFIITLDNLAEMMGNRFTGYGIHFASCAVMDIDKNLLWDFKRSTGAAFISGYTNYVDFDESSLMDLALLNRWIYSVNYGTMFKKLERDYKSFIGLNGFTWYL